MVSLGDRKHLTSALMNFMMDRFPSPYNGIIGRSGLRKIQAIPSTAHGMLKFDNPHQHHNTSGMQNGSRSTKWTSTPRTNGCRSNQSSNPPKVSRTDSHDRQKSVRKRKNGTLQLSQRQLGHIFLETRRYDRRPEVHSGTSLEYPRRMPSYKAKNKGACTGKE
ncbi:hypothetical protein Tco_0330313 [Tanacetum coccineum]